MKKRIVSLILIVVFAMSMIACSDGGAASVTDDTSSSAEKGNETAQASTPPADAEPQDEEAEEKTTYTVPGAVLNLSEEENALLNGELKDNVYINNYFGYKFTAPEGLTLSRQNDGATESTELLSLKEEYENNGYGINL